MEIATRGSRSMLRALRLPSWVKKTTSSPSRPAQIAVELGEPSRVRVARWAKFAPSNSARTSGGSSAIARAYPLDERRRIDRPVAGCEGRADSVLGSRSRLLVARMDHCQQRCVLAEAGDVTETDRVVDAVGL